MKKNLFTFFFLLLFIASSFGQSSQKAANPDPIEAKFSPRIKRISQAFSPNKTHRFLVKGKNWNALISRIEANDAQVELLQSYPATGAALIKTNGAMAKVITHWNEVSFIDIRNQSPQTELLLDNFDLTVNQVANLQRQYPELNGEGMSVCIKEPRYDSSDVDLVGRYFPSPLSTLSTATHATTMATMITGAGNSYYTSQGVAPKALHTSTSFFNILPETQEYFEQFDISVQNHSYGIDIESYYGAEAEAYDQLAFDEGHLIHVFSVGNSGLEQSPEGKYKGIPGYANITGNFKMGKNILTVGSINSFFDLEAITSKGPAYDGRLKPELISYGPGGTSEAAALTSGVSLILQQAYKNLHDSLPPAELIKAVLINGAKDLLTIGPDFQSGYGSIQAGQSLKMIQENNYLLDEIKQGQTIMMPLNIPANAASVKITLCWLDPAAEVNTEKALINDLDLALTDENNQVWLPWSLNTFPHADSLALPAVRKQDTLNPQEQISLVNPAPGLYTIEVHGRELATNNQRFALVYDIELEDQFSWTYPFSGGNIIANQMNLIRWKSSYGNIAGKIEYRFKDQGTDWNVVAEQTSLDLEYSTWDVPDIFSAGELRMIVGTDTFYSGEFVISRPLDMTVELDCGDSLLLSWENIDEASAYQIWSFEGTELVELTQTSENFLVLNGSQENLLSVQPILNDSLRGIRSPLLNLAFQRAGCYIQNFFAREIDEKAELELNISTWYGVKRIVLEKEEDNVFMPLTEFTTPGQLAYIYEDNNLQQGANIYRATVELLDGTLITSNEQIITYTAPSTALLYPNPTFEGEDVIIQTNNLSGSDFRLYDQMGRLVVKMSIDVDTELLFTDLLSRGIYFYDITKNREIIEKGKLIVQ